MFRRKKAAPTAGRNHRPQLLARRNIRSLVEGLERRTHFDATGASILAVDESLPPPSDTTSAVDPSMDSPSATITATLPGEAVDLTGKWSVQGIDALGRTWLGHMAVYQGVEDSNGIAPLEGHFDWEVDGVQRGREWFRGAINPYLRTVVINGHTLENPVEINVDNYFANVSEDGLQLVNGRWEGQGSVPSDNWSAVRVADLDDAAPKPVPAAPSGMYASEVGADRVSLAWVDHSSNEAFFKIERALSAGGEWQLIGTTGANSTAFSDAPLAANTTYFYRVSAVNAAGSSDHSNVFAATPAEPPMTVPAAPRRLVATASSPTEVTLGWVDKSQHETGFAVESASSADGPWVLVATAPADANSFTVGGLSPATAHHFRIRAIGAAGPGAYSDTALATTLSLPGAEAPPFTILSVTNEGSASVVGGGKGRVTVQVQNNAAKGSAAARGYLMLSASADTTLDAADAPVLGGPTPVRVRAGATRTVRLKPNYPLGLPDGGYYLIAHASERADTVMNAQAPAVAVAPTPVTIAPAQITLNGVSVAPDRLLLQPGERAFATLLVTNSGNVAYKGMLSAEMVASTDAAKDTLEDDVSLGSFNRRVNLRPGQTRNIRVEIGAATATLPPGPQFLVARVSGAPLASGLVPSGSAVLSGWLLTIGA